MTPQPEAEEHKMLEMRNRKSGSGKDAETIGTDALDFVANDGELMQRFLDLSGIDASDVRSLAAQPAFFVGLLDFILAHKPTLMAFVGAVGLDPAEVQAAHQKLDVGR
jgi:hypothetical protein